VAAVAGGVVVGAAVVVDCGAAMVLGTAVVEVGSSTVSLLHAATPRIAIEADPLATVAMKRRLVSWGIARLLGLKR
jgi:hypothetical protein